MVAQNSYYGRSDAETFEVVLQRCDILKDRGLSLESPIEVLGERLLQHLNDFCLRSARDQKVSDCRDGFLIRSRNERDFIFFQQRHRLYHSSEVTWQWSNEMKRSMMGHLNGELILRWYRSGTQLFGVYHTPAKHSAFHIDWERAGLDEAIELFARAGKMRVDDASPAGL